MIVTPQALNDHLSNPQWSDGQWRDAEETLAEVESGLEAALFATYITPRTYREVVPILRSGMLDTAYPVFEVSSVGDLPEGTLPDGWVVQDHRIYAALSAWGSCAGVAFVSQVPANRVGMTDAIGQSVVTYQAGWGAVPALVGAIKRKAGRIMANRHDDSVVMRNLDATRPVPLTPEDWTPEELAPLGAFRRLSAQR